MTLSFANLLTAGLALLFVLGLILLLARLLRATGLAPQTAGQRLKVQEVLALDARRRVIILRCGRIFASAGCRPGMRNRPNHDA